MLRSEVEQTRMQVSLAKRGIIRPLVSNRFKLDKATEALQMLKDRRIMGRGVINP
jgi:propanol-preferring alcohol dehydrogenase